MPPAVACIHPHNTTQRSPAQATTANREAERWDALKEQLASPPPPAKGDDEDDLATDAPLIAPLVAADPSDTTLGPEDPLALVMQAKKLRKKGEKKGSKV